MLCSLKSLAPRKGIIGVCILVIMIRGPGKKKKEKRKKKRKKKEKRAKFGKNWEKMKKKEHI